jgi:hypothetical protein
MPADSDIESLTKRLSVGESSDIDTVARDLEGNLRALLLHVLYGNKDVAERQLKAHAELAAVFDGRQYKWMELEHFQEILIKNPARGSEIYWKEMLYRAHIASVLAFLRARNWLAGALIGCDKENIHVIAASLRGFLESAADINSTFKYVSKTLADNFRSIREAIRGKAKVILLKKELEDKLIHFTHARHLKKGDEAPSSHRALTTRDYFEEMGIEFGPLAKAVYEPLCDLTHPGAFSTACFLDVARSEVFDTTKISAIHARLHAAALFVQHAEAFKNAVYLSFNHPLIALRVLHTFPMSEIKIPFVEKIDFSQIATWRHCADSLRKQGVSV